MFENAQSVFVEESAKKGSESISFLDQFLWQN